MGLVAKEDDIKSIIFSYNYININSFSREHTIETKKNWRHTYVKERVFCAQNYNNTYLEPSLIILE